MSTSTITDTAQTSRRQSAREGAAGQPAAPTRSRRRPRLIALGVALSLLGGLGAWVLMQNFNQNVTVLAAGSTISRGDVIEVGDLVQLDIDGASASRFYSTEQQQELIGQTARVEILTGTPFTAEHLGSPTAPDGEAIAGLSLTQAQMPSLPLLPGDRVAVVQTMAPGSVAPENFVPTRYEAEVFSVTRDETTGTWVVNVTLDSQDDAVSVSAIAASGNVALVILEQIVAGE